MHGKKAFQWGQPPSGHSAPQRLVSCMTPFIHQLLEPLLNELMSQFPAVAYLQTWTRQVLLSPMLLATSEHPTNLVGLQSTAVKWALLGHAKFCSFSTKRLTIVSVLLNSPHEPVPKFEARFSPYLWLSGSWYKDDPQEDLRSSFAQTSALCLSVVLHFRGTYDFPYFWCLYCVWIRIQKWTGNECVRCGTVEEYHSECTL